MPRAKDGLPARVSGPWTREKLTYLQKYATAFMTAMAPKRNQGKWDKLVYIDLLAGPGKGVDANTGEEFDGSPLLALGVKPAFDRLYLTDLDESNINALGRRIPGGDQSRVDLRVGDCNELASEIVGKLSQRTLGLAFIDPQGFQATFKLFQALAKRRIDVLYLFPGGIGVTRNLPAFVKKAGGPLDALIPGWRKLKRARLAAGELSDEELASHDQPLVMEFRRQMANLGYQYSDQGDPYFTNEKNVKMYHLLFFSQHSVGLTLWRGIRQIEPSGQRRLL